MNTENNVLNNTNTTTDETELNSNENHEPTYHTLPSPDGTTARLNVCTGEVNVAFSDISGAAAPLGVEISHIFKEKNISSAYGAGFGLNLDEYLTKSTASDTSGTDYIYTDPYGEKHGFTEYFYYASGQEKIYVDAEDVTVDVSGSLSYDGKKVTRELRSSTGWEAVTQLDGVDGIELFEQRSDERKQLEEQLPEYKKKLENYVMIDAEAGTTLWQISEPAWEHYSACVPSETELFLPVETANIYLNCIVEMGALGETAEESQIQQYQEQITDIASQKNAYVEEFQSLLVTYLKTKSEYDNLVEQEPVAYMNKDGITKGFNEAGYLVQIVDSYQNYISIERDEYHRIVKISDKNGNFAKLVYAGELLQSMTDIRGNRIAYQYENGMLTEVSYSSGKKLTFLMDSYSGNLLRCKSNIAVDTATTQSDADNMFLECFYELDGSFTGMNYCSGVSAISHGSATETYLCISSLEYLRSASETIVTEYPSGNYDYAIKTTYRFDENNNLSEYYVERDGVVIEAEKHTYLPGESDTVEYADEALLYLTPLSSFTFGANKTDTTVLDAFRNPVTRTVTWMSHLDGTMYRYAHESVTSYTYDNDHRLMKESTATKTVRVSDQAEMNQVTSVSEYFYNSAGSIIRTESYILGRELSDGKTVEETVYDENGHAVKSFSYNTLDPSSKFYTESERDESGRITFEVDETGKHKTTFDYLGNTNLVCCEHYPNGGTMSYGYDGADLANAITASTAEGEANSTVTHYTSGEVTRLVSGNNTVEYTYDGKRRITGVKLNGENHVACIYTDDVNENEKKVDRLSVTYGDSTTPHIYTKDKQGNVIRSEYGTALLYSAEYSPDGRILKRSGMLNDDMLYTYDSDKRLTGYSYDVQSEAMQYDYEGKQTQHTLSNSFLTSNTVYNYTYDTATKRLTELSVLDLLVRPAEDASGRSTGKSVQHAGVTVSEERIDYLKHGDHATNLPSAIRYARGGAWVDKLQYTYDVMGNISAIYEDDELVARYEYDSLGRLIREDNKPMNKTTVFAYDANGNITSRREWSFTTKESNRLFETEYTDKKNYLYEGDRLVSYDGEAITYNAIGNPVSYRGKTLAWTRDRLLSRYGEDVFFNYDGLNRLTAHGMTEVFHDRNNRIVGICVNGQGIDYLYDGAGLLGFKVTDFSSGMPFATTTYLYERDIQGNIRAILDTNGAVVVKYVYDAWGNHLVLDANGQPITDENHIGNLNPFRYRGYYYDRETGLYYLKSRYYDPVVGRFISFDYSVAAEPILTDLSDKNFYAYCDNNPVARIDSEGEVWNWLIGAGVGAIAGFVGQIISDTVTSFINGKVTISNWQTYAGAVVGGAVGGAVLGGTGSISASNAVTGMVTTGLGQTLEKITIKDYDKSWGEIGANAVADGAISYGLGKIPGIQNISAGRNNQSAVYRSGLTRLRNKTAKRMSAKVISKGIRSSIVGGLALDGYYGIKQHAYDRTKGLIRRLCR